ncbi:hypothetical protein I550_5684 [Mycobacterium intracellulare 1956]|uniref:Uncharacterized protein n=1 Tax=Mycobacterium intracellulare 1956 TaxID=1299331 RepID=X8CDZ2_MYCIT|nr:hypothetical protein L842_5477 [Mycobacterium intracellulare MIN_052511_1280]ETZ39779.1 hypothetical protein L843_0065 [Mycobacterium intracellulare MIN_061107_1834]EUA29420.1 hypothetical protein I548_2607 [Mycobacterium intracellulare]EUA54046.1 hypothetical protein I550_5684 [Mycobacterium intracellulare 1956]
MQTTTLSTPVYNYVDSRFVAKRELYFDPGRSRTREMRR